MLKKSFAYLALGLGIFSLIRLLLLVRYWSYFKELGWGQVLGAMVMGLRFDLSVLAVLLVLPLLWLNFPWPYRWAKLGRLADWLIPWLFGVCLLLLGADLIYFQYVKRHVTYEFLNVLDDMGTMAQIAWSGFWGSCLLALLAFALVWFLCRRIAKALEPDKPRPSWSKLLLLLLLLAALGRGSFSSKPIAIVDAFESGQLAYGQLLLNGIFSMGHSSIKAVEVEHHFFTEDQALALAYPDRRFDNPTFPLQEHRTRQRPQEPRRNLVFVLIESLSFKYLDAFSQAGLGVTPNLDRLAAQGLRFTNFYASGQRSIEGIQSVLTGIPSLIGLPTLDLGLQTKFQGLGQLAGKNGYSTWLSQSAKRRSFRMDAVAGAVGFEHYFGAEDMPLLLNYPDPSAAKFGWDHEHFSFMLGQLRQAPQPFLSFMITGTTHSPFAPLPADLGLTKYPHGSETEGGFLNAMAYLDWSLGQFMEQAKKEPWFDQTIFVFTADHALPHFLAEESYKAWFHIPLILYAPGLIAPGEVQQVASQADLYPTLLELLDLEGTTTSLGRNLLERQPGFALTREGSIMGLVTDRGYVRHSLLKRMDQRAFDPSLGEEGIQALEKRLLALDQLAFELIQANRWLEE